MPRKSPYKIVLDPATRETLETRARRYTSAYRDVVRARIVLLAEGGLDNDEIALRLNTTPAALSPCGASASSKKASMGWRSAWGQESRSRLDSRGVGPI